MITKKRAIISLSVICLLLTCTTAFFCERSFTFLDEINDAALFRNFTCQQRTLERLSCNKIIFWTIDGEDASTEIGKFHISIRRLPSMDPHYPKHLNFTRLKANFISHSNRSVLMILRDRRGVSEEVGEPVFDYLKNYFSDSEKNRFPAEFSDLNDLASSWIDGHVAQQVK